MPLSVPRLPRPRSTPYTVGFVCLGNICRSPMADVVLTHHVAHAGLAGKVEVSSSGTGDWHVGEPMDPRAAAQLVASGYDASAHRAQQFDRSWLMRDLLLAMDDQNLEDLTAGRGPSDRVRLFRSFDPLAPAAPGPGDLDVPDPWFGGDDGFVHVLAMVERTCRQLVVALAALDL